MSVVKQKLQEFLAGLDTNDRERLHALGLAAFDEYVTELPGPDKFVKSKIRPSVSTALTNAIADLLS